MHQYALNQPRLTVQVSYSGGKFTSFAADTLKGLSGNPKWLNPMYFYDARGSLLFQRICRLPEYYVTRIEHEILERCADEISAYSLGGMSLIEFGSGDAEKTRLLIESLIRRQGSLQYVPIDISSSAVVESSRRLLRDYPPLSVTAHIAEYRAGLSRLMDNDPGQKLIAFMGSNLGNFEPPQAVDFLSEIKKYMSADDYLMIGNDLVKDESILVAAYDDAQGVTAQFNLNVLSRINRELGGTFDTSRFNHLALYNSGRGRIEMHLRSKTPHSVLIRNLCTSFRFEKEETIHTENSYKYDLRQLDDLFDAAGFRLVKRWFDSLGWFSVNLLGTA